MKNCDKLKYLIKNIRGLETSRKKLVSIKCEQNNLQIHMNF